MLAARISSSLNKIIQNSHFKKKVSLEEQESPERGPVSSRKTDRHHVLRLLSCLLAHNTVLDYALCATIMFRNSFQDRTKFYLYVKDTIRCYLGKSVQIENT